MIEDIQIDSFPDEDWISIHTDSRTIRIIFQPLCNWRSRGGWVRIYNKRAEL